MSQTAVITGSTGGIGTAIADQLAQAGWTLVLINRSPEKAEHQKAALMAQYPQATVHCVPADLLDVNQIKDAAAKVLKVAPKIDTLYNNSGVLTSERVMSKQGHESNYAIHVLAPYIFLQALRPALQRTEDEVHAVVVNTTSTAQSSARSLDVSALSDPDTIGGLFGGAYAKTKLALTVMGTALAEELAREGIMLRSVDPGPVATSMTKSNDAMPWFVKPLVPLLFKQPAKQAAKVINAARPDAFGGQSGIYITDGKQRKLPALARDPDTQKALLAKLAIDAASPV